MTKKSAKASPNWLKITIPEADFLLKNAEQIDKLIQPRLEDTNSLIGPIITSNVCIGLSIEIYLKSIMIADRADGPTRGHKLKDLFGVLPPAIQDSIKAEYNNLYTGKEKMAELSYKISEETPDPPESLPPGNFSDFDYSLNKLSDMFTFSRYYYEKIGTEWVNIGYYFEAGKCLAYAVKKAFHDFEKGKFK